MSRRRSTKLAKTLEVCYRDEQYSNHDAASVHITEMARQQLIEMLQNTRYTVLWWSRLESEVEAH